MPSRGRPNPARQEKRRGREEPRVYTPPLRELTPETSLGFSVVTFAKEILGIRLHPWQRWLLIHMLELREDNTLRFRTVVVLVARQNGKSLVSQVLALWFMYVYGLPLVLGTAQDLDTAEEVWQGAVDMVTELDDDDQPVRPDLYGLLDRVVQVNGKKALVLKSRKRYKVKAANRRAGRGLAGDLVLLDELREHQSWDAWGSITKTTMAREMALILCLSNAGDATSIVLRYLRQLGHNGCGDPDGINTDNQQPAPETLIGDARDEFTDDAEDLLEEDSVGIFEWSAPPGCNTDDRDAWTYANPAMNHPNGIAERTIAAACRTDPDWIFRTEVLCQWVDTAIEGPFPTGAWEACFDEHSRVAPGERIVLGIDTSWDRSTTHIAMAGNRADGIPHIAVIASRPGQDWVADWLTSDYAPPFDQIVVQGKSAPATGLVSVLREAGHEVTEWGGADLGLACGDLYDRIRAAIGEAPIPERDGQPTGQPAPELRHRPQPILDVAAATAATKPSGDAFVWDRRKSPADVAPLVAVTEALWGLTRTAPPTTSAYEAADLLVV